MNKEVRPLPENFFTDWKQREALAEGMIPLIGKLYRESNVSTYMYGKSMVNKSVTDLMKSHCLYGRWKRMSCQSLTLHLCCRRFVSTVWGRRI